MRIRQEIKADHDRVYQLIKSAFSSLEISSHNEQDLVDRLRLLGCFIPELSLVAEEQGQILGYILFTELKAGDAILLDLAPVAVDPDHQNRGIGSALILEGHRIGTELGYRGSVVVGHAAYYPKFGYQPASKWHLSAPFDVPDENLMAVELIPDGLKDVSGLLEYPEVFFE